MRLKHISGSLRLIKMSWIIDLFLYMLIGCFAFVGGFFFGLKKEDVVIEGEEEDRTKDGEPKKADLVVFRPWHMWYKRLKRFLAKKVWIVEGIFLNKTASGYLAEIDYGKRDIHGRLKWMAKKRKYQFWHPKQIQLPGGRTLAVFIDGIPIKIMQSSFVPIPIKAYMQMLTDSVVMSKRRYPKLMGGISANAWMWIIILIGLAIGVVILMPRFSSFITEV